MGFLFDLLTLPVLGPPKLVLWASQAMLTAAEQEVSEGPIRGRLLRLQQRYEAGEIGEEDYDTEEKALLERLNAVLEARARVPGSRQV